MNLETHPCFSRKAHKSFGRVHLPVAPRCNIQCKFCNRKFDCVNESRPGVTSGVLTPDRAKVYLDEVFQKKDNISVVGIAGPGDPFANPEETLETLKWVRDAHPGVLLCVATNGLNLPSYLDELAHLNVSHVTVTVNAVDPKIAEKIYSWIRFKKKVLRAEKGVTILLENQIAGIEGLKRRGIMVKINTIILPGINEDHIEAVSRKMSKLGVDILNCVPYYPCKGSALESLPEPSWETVKIIRKKAGRYIKQMHHCTRCRADAVGLLSEFPDKGLMEKLRAYESMEQIGSKTCCKPSLPELPKFSQRPPVSVEDGKMKGQSFNHPNIAVASMEGVLVNQHLGEVSKLFIYGKKNGMISLLETRQTPPAGLGAARWEQLANIIGDCATLLVSGIGENPRRFLNAKGINIMEIEGLIEDALQAVFENKPLNHMVKYKLKPCDGGCLGNALGCG